MNKEMIKTLIDDGWEWVACDKGGTQHVYEKRPIILYDVYVREDGKSKYYSVPSCLFPDITFKNSPVELKTLLDDEDKNSIEYKQQQEIRRLINGNFDYIIREWNNKTIAVYKGGGGTTKTEHLCGLCPDKYKKVYLRDLLKKRKVKKSVWVAVDEDKQIYLYSVKPIRADGEFEAGVFEASKVEDLDFLTGVLPTWKDEPLELTYEVEE